ncbi:MULTISPECIES: heavy metal-responsive transcriptional regulator [Kocuria]|uniref:heavy metal-responsive transcriptional regulator n=1 Tax=Kocuria TaxID=57493 RepID=UPI00103B163D|nr:MULTISPECIES: heavy metal-responsive transcriptional regulator [Kocuria]MDT0120116.1 heavy metal-responsive transcriptional regulator [Kocuria sp. PD6]QBJ22351.1 heavy metal-responsive transcriptional regulator [Kocuria indica]
MKIGELAQLSGVSTKTIRYYESIGVLPEPARTTSGYRDYEQSFVDRLTFIRSAQRLGVSLEEIRQILAIRERNEAPCGYVRGVLESQLEGIGQRIHELQVLREHLVQIVSEADQLPAPQEGCTCQLIEHDRHTTGSASEAMVQAETT